MRQPSERRAQGLIELLILILTLVGSVGVLLIAPFVGLPLLLPAVFAAPSPTLVQITGVLLVIASLSSLLTTLIVRALGGRLRRGENDEAAKRAEMGTLALFVTLVRLAVGAQLYLRGSVDDFTSLEATLVGAFLLFPLASLPFTLIWERIKRKRTPSA